MKPNKYLIIISSMLAATLAIGCVYFFSTKEKSISPYSLYKQSHPDFTKSESEWLIDLASGNLDYVKRYTVEFNSNGGTSVNKQIVEKGGKVSEPTPPTKKGYTFKEWTYNEEPWIFSGYAVSENIVLNASWTINVYDIEYDLNGGTISTTNPTNYTIESSFVLSEPTRAGYTFAGWYDSNNQKYEKINKGMVGNIVLTAFWSANSYLLTVSPENPLDGSVNISSKEMCTDESISLEATPNGELAFKGWYHDDVLISKDNPYIFTMPPKDFAIIAKFGETRHLSVQLYDEESGVVYGDGDYLVDELVTVVCDVIKGVFKGWRDENGIFVSKSASYTFTMPSYDYTLEAIFMTDEEIKQYIWDKEHGVIPVIDEEKHTFTYGLYPQAVELDESIINALNTIHAPESNGYYLYHNGETKEYYSKIIASPIDLGKDSSGDYVKTYFDDGVTEIVPGKEYWFKVMPIVWNILCDEGDKYIAISEKLLDISQYHSSYINRFDEDGNIIYPNNYKYSDIRNWLTTDFYNSAFNFNDEELITMDVDNSADSTDVSPNIYACDNTQDKVCLPSYKDYMNTSYGFDPSSSSTRTRLSFTTDYSRARGAWYSNKPTYMNYGYSWLRSPGSEYEIESWRLSYGGGLNHHNDVTISNSCVRVMINLKK